jgi:DNA polymerase-3 subunit delta'
MSGLIRALMSLLEDLLLLRAGTPTLVKNIDLAVELRRIADEVSLEWIETATKAAIRLESGMRRNLLRSLALDSFAAELVF